MSVRRKAEQVVDVSSNTDKKRFRLGNEFSIGFYVSLASSFAEIDKPGLSCDNYAALIATLRQKRVCDASNCEIVANTSSNLFLTDGVVTPFAFFSEML